MQRGIVVVVSVVELVSLMSRSLCFVNVSTYHLQLTHSGMPSLLQTLVTAFCYLYQSADCGGVYTCMYVTTYVHNYDYVCMYVCSYVCKHHLHLKA